MDVGKEDASRGRCSGWPNRTEYQSHMSTHDASDLLTWDTFSMFLKEQFDPKNPALHWNMTLMSIRQEAAEMVTTYCSRFRRTMIQLQEASGNLLPELTVVAWFQEGLRPDSQRELEKDLPTKLTTAFRSGEKLERIWKCQQRQRESDISCFAVNQMSSTVPFAAVHRSRISSNPLPDGGWYVASPTVCLRFRLWFHLVVSCFSNLCHNSRKLLLNRVRF